MLCTYAYSLSPPPVYLFLKFNRVIDALFRACIAWISQFLLFNLHTGLRSSFRALSWPFYERSFLPPPLFPFCISAQLNEVLLFSELGSIFLRFSQFHLSVPHFASFPSNESLPGNQSYFSLCHALFLWSEMIGIFVSSLSFFFLKVSQLKRPPLCSFPILV